MRLPEQSRERPFYFVIFKGAVECRVARELAIRFIWPQPADLVSETEIADHLAAPAVTTLEGRRLTCRS